MNADEISDLDHRNELNVIHDQNEEVSLLTMNNDLEDFTVMRRFVPQPLPILHPSAELDSNSLQSYQNRRYISNLSDVERFLNQSNDSIGDKPLPEIQDVNDMANELQALSLLRKDEREALKLLLNSLHLKQAQNKALSSATETLESRILELENQNLKERVDKQQMAVLLANANKDKALLESECNQLRKKIITLSDQEQEDTMIPTVTLEQIRGELLSNAYEKIEQMSSIIFQNHQEATRQIQELEIANKRLAGFATSYETEIMQLTNQIAQLTVLQHAHERQLVTLLTNQKSVCSSQEQEVIKLNCQLKDTRDRVESLEGEKINLLMHQHLLTIKVNDYESQIEALKEQLEESEANFHDVNKYNLSLQEQVNLLSKSNNTSYYEMQQVENMNALNMNYQIRENQLTKELMDARERIAALSNENDMLLERLEKHGQRDLQQDASSYAQSRDKMQSRENDKSAIDDEDETDTIRDSVDNNSLSWLLTPSVHKQQQDNVESVNKQAKHTSVLSALASFQEWINQEQETFFQNMKNKPFNSIIEEVTTRLKSTSQNESEQVICDEITSEIVKLVYICFRVLSKKINKLKLALHESRVSANNSITVSDRHNHSDRKKHYKTENRKLRLVLHQILTKLKEKTLAITNLNNSLNTSMDFESDSFLNNIQQTFQLENASFMSNSSSASENNQHAKQIQTIQETQNSNTINQLSNTIRLQEEQIVVLKNATEVLQNERRILQEQLKVYSDELRQLQELVDSNKELGRHEERMIVEKEMQRLSNNIKQLTEENASLKETLTQNTLLIENDSERIKDENEVNKAEDSSFQASDDQLDTLKNALEEISQQLQVKEQLVDELQKTIASREQMLEEFRDDLQRMTQQKEKTTEQLLEKEKIIDNLQNEKKVAREEFDSKIQNINNQFNEIIQIKENIINNLQTTVNDNLIASQNKEHLREEISDLRSQLIQKDTFYEAIINSTRKEMEETIEKLTTEKKILHEQLIDKENEISQTNEKIGSLQIDFDEVLQREKKLNEELQIKHSLDMDALKNALLDVTTQLNQSTEDKCELRENINQLKVEITTLQSCIEEERSHMRNMQQSYTKQYQESLTVKRENDELKQKVAELNAALELQSKEFNELKQAQDQPSKYFMSSTTQTVELGETSQILQHRCDELNNTLEEKESELRRLRVSIEVEKTTSDAEINRLNESLKSIGLECHEYQRRIDSISAENLAHLRTIEQLRDSNSELESKVDQMQYKLNNLAKENENFRGELTDVEKVKEEEITALKRALTTVKEEFTIKVHKMESEQEKTLHRLQQIAKFGVSLHTQLTGRNFQQRSRILEDCTTSSLHGQFSEKLKLLETRVVKITQKQQKIAREFMHTLTKNNLLVTTNQQLMRDNDELSQLIDNLEGVAEEKEFLSTQLRRDKDNLLITIEELQRTVESQTSTISSLQHNLETSNATFQQRQSQVDQLHNEIAQLQQANNDQLRALANKHSKELSDLRAAFNEEKEVLSEQLTHNFQRQLEDEKKRFQVLFEQHNALRSAIDQNYHGVSDLILDQNLSENSSSNYLRILQKNREQVQALFEEKLSELASEKASLQQLLSSEQQRSRELAAQLSEKMLKGISLNEATQTENSFFQLQSTVTNDNIVNSNNTSDSPSNTKDFHFYEEQERIHQQRVKTFNQQIEELQQELSSAREKQYKTLQELTIMTNKYNDMLNTQQQQSSQLLREKTLVTEHQEQVLKLENTIMQLRQQLLVSNSNTLDKQLPNYPSTTSSLSSLNLLQNEAHSAPYMNNNIYSQQTNNNHQELAQVVDQLRSMLREQEERSAQSKESHEREVEQLKQNLRKQFKRELQQREEDEAKKIQNLVSEFEREKRSLLEEIRSVREKLAYAKINNDQSQVEKPVMVNCSVETESQTMRVKAVQTDESTFEINLPRELQPSSEKKQDETVPLSVLHESLLQLKKKLTEKYQHKLAKQSASFEKEKAQLIGNFAQEKEQILQVVRQECQDIVRETSKLSHDHQRQLLQQLHQNKQEVNQSTSSIHLGDSHDWSLLNSSFAHDRHQKFDVRGTISSNNPLTTTNKFSDVSPALSNFNIPVSESTAPRAHPLHQIAISPIRKQTSHVDSTSNVQNNHIFNNQHQKMESMQLPPPLRFQQEVPLQKPREIPTPMHAMHNSNINIASLNQSTGNITRPPMISNSPLIENYHNIPDQRIQTNFSTNSHVSQMQIPQQQQQQQPNLPAFNTNNRATSNPMNTSSTTTNQFQNINGSAQSTSQILRYVQPSDSMLSLSTTSILQQTNTATSNLLLTSSCEKMLPIFPEMISPEVTEELIHSMQRRLS